MGQPRVRFWEFTHSLFQEVRLRCSGRQLVEVDRGRLPAKAAKSKCVRIILGKEAIFPFFFFFSFIFPLLGSLKAGWQLSTVVSLVIAFQFCMRLLVTILDIHYIVIITLHYIVRLLLTIPDVHDIVFNAMMIK